MVIITIKLLVENLLKFQRFRALKLLIFMLGGGIIKEVIVYLAFPYRTRAKNWK